jgi:hypothetical protein
MDRRTLIATPLAASLAGLAGAGLASGVQAQTGSAAGPQNGPQSGLATYEGSFFKRQLIAVSNMERALGLWRDVIGFQAGAITTSGPQSYSREVFNIPARASLRFCTMSAGPQQVRTLALLEVTGVRLPRQRGIRTAGAVVDARGRLEAIISWATAQGLTVFGPRPLTNPDQGTGTEQGFLDWDGNVVVLYQFPIPAPPPVR